MSDLYRIHIEVDYLADSPESARAQGEKIAAKVSTVFQRARCADVELIERDSLARNVALEERRAAVLDAIKPREADAKLTYQSRGEGRYRIFGPKFWADVHAHSDGIHFVVEKCNNVLVNARDIEAWCERNIQL